MSNNSDDSSAITIIVVYCLLLLFSTCRTCGHAEKTKDRLGTLNDHMLTLEDKLDTLIKYQKQK